MSLGPAGWLPTKATYARVRKRSVGRGNEWHACCSSVRALCRMKKELAGEEEEEEELGCVRRGTDGRKRGNCCDYIPYRTWWLAWFDRPLANEPRGLTWAQYVCVLARPECCMGAHFGQVSLPARHTYYPSRERPSGSILLLLL